jgi:hypothetical protein
MNKSFFLFLLLTCSVVAFAQTGELKGRVTERNTENIVEEASVSIYYGDSLFTSVVPDFEGNYDAKNLPAGRVTVICKKDAYATLIEKNIPVNDGKTTVENFAMRKTSRSNDIDLIEYKSAGEEKPAEPAKPSPVPEPEVVQTPPIPAATEPITLIPDSEVNQGSQKQGWFFKVGSREPMRMKFFAGNLSYYLERNPQATAELNKYVRMKSTKLGLQIGFGGLMGLYAASFFFDKKSTEYFGGYRAFLLGGGLVCIGFSAFIEEKQDKHLKKAVDIYNAGK